MEELPDRPVGGFPFSIPRELCIATKFLATFDLHFGFERRNGHKVAIHDEKAWAAVLAFAKDFKPDVWILGGDHLDCSCISHHNKGKPGRVEGLRLLSDAAEGRQVFIEPVEQLAKRCIYMEGNHEFWLRDLTEEMPALEGLVGLKSLLKLDAPKWEIVDQGAAFRLGKLTFIHGDTLSGGEHVAKNAVVTYESNIRFGHFHTYQTYTKSSPLDYKNAKTGIAVPCLCTKVPSYGKGKPNRWLQGFNYGYVHPNGTFNDYVATILDGKTVVHGKEYAA